MKRGNPSTGIFGGAHKWITGILTTSAALLALMVNARNLGLTPWFGLLDLNFANHAARRIALTPRADTLLALGDTALITATVTDAHGAALAGATLRWRSLDTTVATVDSTGAIVARAPGQASIEVTVREVLARATVLVRQQPTAVVLAGDSAVRMADGDSLRLLAHAVDARGNRVRGLTPWWQSADSGVLVVDSSGAARAIAAGRAYVWASAGESRVRLRVDVELTPASLVLQSGEGQRAPAGRRLPDPVVLQVRARGGQPVPGAVVSLTTENGEGLVEPATATSDADGRVRAQWTLSPRAGSQRLLARVTAVDSALAVSAEAEPVPGNVRVEVVSPELKGVAGAELAQPVVVRVTDTLGMALASVRLGWSTLDGGTITGSARTDSSGAAQAYWTLGSRAGRQRLLVQVGNARLIPPTPVFALVEPGAATVLAVLGGQGQRVAAGTRLPRPVVVAVRDSSGNAVAGATLTLKPSAGTVEDSVAVTDTEGKASIRWTLGPRAEEQRLVVGIAGSKVATRVTAVGRVGAPATVTLAAPAPAGANGVLRVVATVTDAGGNPVRKARLGFRATSGTIAPARAESDSAGRVAIRWTPAAGKNGEVELTATVVGSKVTASRTIRAALTQPATAARRKS